MKTNNVRNFYIIAILVTIIVFRVMQSNAEEKIDLSLTTVKKKQNEYIEEAKLPLRTGEVNTRKLEYIDNAQSLGLARADVSEFFDKTIPLDKPNMPNTYILAWSALALSEIFTFGFNDTDFRLGLASDYFTESGWEGFAKILKDQKLIENIKNNQQVLFSSPKSTPVLQAENVQNDIREWYVQVPMILTYQTGSKQINTTLLVTVVIVRSADPKYPYGIAINQMVAPYQ